MRCKHCAGRIVREWDRLDGDTLKCINCGRTPEVAQVQPLEMPWDEALVRAREERQQAIKQDRARQRYQAKLQGRSNRDPKNHH